MKSVRRFFGTLCGGSGRVTEANNDESPYDPPKEHEEAKSNKSEPVVTAKDADIGTQKLQLSSHSLTKSSYDSLNESPSIRQQQKVIDAACSVNSIYDVSLWNPEGLGAKQADQVFQDAKEILDPFIKHCQCLSSLLLSFARQYSRDKRPDFRKCYQVYVRNKATHHQEESHVSKSHLSDTAELDLEDPTMEELKAIAISGRQLLNKIDKIRPRIDEKIAEASGYDVKESGKEKGEDGAHQGLLSKFSAPGKYRRNMKHLKENRRLLDSVYCEIESIIKTIEKPKGDAGLGLFDQQHLDQSGSRTLLSLVADDAPLCQEEIKIEAKATSEVEAVPEPSVDVIVLTDPQSPEHYLLLENEACVDQEREQDENTRHREDIEVGVAAVNTATNTAAQTVESPQDKHDDSAQEHADVIEPLRPTSPLSLQGKTSDSIEMVDGGKILDFGSYIVVDPTAQDEVMLRRSRSLDSLCSVTSRRTMSRYGSYEFVTDFEIKIAEKAEEGRQRQEVHAPPQNAGISFPKTARTTIPARSAAFPIYKYTEVDYNALGR